MLPEPLHYAGQSWRNGSLTMLDFTLCSVQKSKKLLIDKRYNATPATISVHTCQFCKDIRSASCALRGTSKKHSARSRCCAETRSNARAKRGSQVQEMPAQ